MPVFYWLHMKHTEMIPSAGALRPTEGDSAPHARNLRPHLGRSQVPARCPPVNILISSVKTRMLTRDGGHSAQVEMEILENWMSQLWPMRPNMLHFQLSQPCRFVWAQISAVATGMFTFQQVICVKIRFLNKIQSVLFGLFPSPQSHWSTHPSS